MSFDIRNAALQLLIADIGTGAEHYLPATTCVRLAREIDEAASLPRDAEIAQLVKLDVVIAQVNGEPIVYVKNTNRKIPVQDLTVQGHAYDLPESVLKAQGSWTVLYAGDIASQDGYIIDSTWSEGQ